MTTVALVSSKGGVGKSTLTGHLACEAERLGAGPVAIVDLDPQGSLAAWWNNREASTPRFARTDLRRLPQDLDALARAGMALVVIDTPPALFEIIAAAIAAADLVVIPCRPSPHDLRSVSAVVELCQQARTLHVFALNAATARSRLAAEAVEVLATTAPVLKTVLHQRQLFASSMIDGRTAGELDPRSAAAEEITALWHDITAHLRHHGKES